MNTRTVSRVGAIDRMRGLAIALMALDHALVLVAPASVVRLTVTRASLPLFGYCIAYTLDRRDGARSTVRTVGILSVGAVVSVALWLAWPEFPSQPDVLVIIGWILLYGSRWLVRAPYACAALGIVQAVYLPFNWHGYQPGLVLAWIALGVLATRSEGVAHRQAALMLPAWLERIGRRPLTWYVVHLAPLATIAAVT